MIATIQKIDSDGIKSTFTIIGSTIDDIGKQVYELQEFSRRNATYERYGVLDYGNEKENKFY